MKKIIKILVIILVLLLSSCQNTKTNNSDLLNQNTKKDINFCQQFIDKGYYYKVWSNTSPQINETHIFCGEINSRGKPVGFHSKINGKIPITVQILKKEKSNKIGVYNAKIKIYDIKNKVFKNKFSSIFPEYLSKKEVEQAILNAWKNKKYYKNSKFVGPSGLGFEITGYTYKGKNKINTAYPIYKK